MAGEEYDVSGRTVRLTESGPTLRQPDTESDVATTLVQLGSDSAPGVVDPSPVSFGRERASRYEKKKSLGEGGMGEVILCKDAWIGREVATKIAHRASGSRPGAQERFLREVRVQGQLEHPGIVPVYDLGRDEDGATFFTMKRIKGHTLEEIIAGLRAGDADTLQQHTRRKLLSALSQVCLTVAFAHSRGVVHRDLKPANIMLGDFGEVYVLDWGVAKVRGADDDPSVADPVDPQAAGRTEAGALLGTPGYMAPEQVRGESVDAQADVYALGAILFELLALEPVHRGRTLEALFASTLSGGDTSPAERAPEREVPPELDAICRRALAISAPDRFAGARDLHDAIERFLDGERDLERRRELSTAHAQAARRALERAEADVGQAEQERALAMRELGASLALDPTNETARAAMVDVLLAPSEELPPGAAAELELVRRRDRMRNTRRAVWAFGSWYLGMPFVIWMGVRNWVPVILFDVLLLALVLYKVWMSTTGNVTPKYMRWSIPLVFANVAGLAGFFGPFVIVPAVAVGCVAIMIIGLRANRETRAFVAFSGLCSVFVPALLQASGLVSPSYVFEEGTIRLLPLTMTFPVLPTSLFVILTTAITVIASAALVGKGTAQLIEAEHRVFAQAFRLRQLLPEGARVPSLAPPPISDQAPSLRACGS